MIPNNFNNNPCGIELYTSFVVISSVIETLIRAAEDQFSIQCYFLKFLPEQAEGKEGRKVKSSFSHLLVCIFTIHSLLVSRSVSPSQLFLVISLCVFVPPIRAVPLPSPSLREEKEKQKERAEERSSCVFLSYLSVPQEMAS